MSHSQKQINRLYLQNAVSTVQAIMLFVAALFSTALLPSLIVRYFFAEQDLFAPPAIVEYIPVISYAVAMLYFVYVLVSNFNRNRKIKVLTAQATEDFGCCGECSPESSNMPELRELEQIVDEALGGKTSQGKTTRRKKSTKTKKSA